MRQQQALVLFQNTLQHRKVGDADAVPQSGNWLDYQDTVMQSAQKLCGTLINLTYHGRCMWVSKVGNAAGRTCSMCFHEVQQRRSRQAMQRLPAMLPQPLLQHEPCHVPCAQPAPHTPSIYRAKLRHLSQATTATGILAANSVM